MPCLREACGAAGGSLPPAAAYVAAPHSATRLRKSLSSSPGSTVDCHHFRIWNHHVMKYQNSGDWSIINIIQVVLTCSWVDVNSWNTPSSIQTSLNKNWSIKHDQPPLKKLRWSKSTKSRQPLSLITGHDKIYLAWKYVKSSKYL